MAKQDGLQDKLVTNQERFQSICQTLADSNLPIQDRFAAIKETAGLFSLLNSRFSQIEFACDGGECASLPALNLNLPSHGLALRWSIRALFTRAWYPS